MLAKKRSALVNLHEQIRENRIDKRYYAVGHGDWLAGWGRRRIVKEPLHKYLTRRRRAARAGPGRRPRVAYGVQPDRALRRTTRWVEAELKTGRTHQIRVHMAHLGLPIAGDAKYGDFALNKDLARPNANPSLKRMFLHAYRLKLVHPATGRDACRSKRRCRRNAGASSNNSNKILERPNKWPVSNST